MLDNYFAFVSDNSIIILHVESVSFDTGNVNRKVIVGKLVLATSQIVKDRAKTPGCAGLSR